MPSKTIRKLSKQEAETGLQDVLTVWGLGEATNIEIPVVGEEPRQEQQGGKTKTTSRHEEEYEYLQLPTKQSQYTKYNVSPDYGRWVLELPNGYILDEELLEKLGLMRTVGIKKYVVKPLYDEIKLYCITNRGSRRRPYMVVDVIISPSRDEIVKLWTDTEKGRELYGKIRETKEIFNTAFDKIDPIIEYGQPPEISPKIEINTWGLRFEGATLILHPLPANINYEDRRRYGLVTITGENYLAHIMPEIEKILAKYGFTKGKYGGYITRNIPDKDTVIKMMNEIKDLIVEHQDKIVKIYLDEKRLLEKAKAKAIEDARRTLGIGTAVPPTRSLVYTEVAKEIISMVKRARTKRKLEEKIEKATEEFVEKLENITPEDLARIMAERGYVRRNLIVFDLPSEYRKSRVVYRREGKAIIEERHLSTDPRQYRSLRKKFYNILHKIAYRTPAGWIMVDNPDKKHLEELNKIIGEFNKLAGTSRTVWIYETYLPRDTVVEWLRKNIAEQKANIEKIKKKLQSEELKRRDMIRLMKMQSEALEELNRLEDELKKLLQELEEQEHG